jgi:hypothetical protein
VGEHNDQVQIHGSVGSVWFMVPVVRYIANSSSRNTISVDQLANDHGLVTVFEARCCYVKDRGTEQIVGKGRLRNGTYLLDYLLIDKVSSMATLLSSTCVQKKYSSGFGVTISLKKIINIYDSK